MNNTEGGELSQQTSSYDKTSIANITSPTPKSVVQPSTAAPSSPNDQGDDGPITEVDGCVSTLLSYCASYRCLVL